MNRRIALWVLGTLITGFYGCASSDGGLCGGSYKSEAEMERALDVSSFPTRGARTIRY